MNKEQIDEITTTLNAVNTGLLSGIYLQSVNRAVEYARGLYGNTEMAHKGYTELLIELHLRVSSIAESIVLELEDTLTKEQLVNSYIAMITIESTELADVVMKEGCMAVVKSVVLSEVNLDK